MSLRLPTRTLAPRSRPRRARRDRRHLHGRAASVLDGRRHAEPGAPEARQAGSGEEACAQGEGARRRRKRRSRRRSPRPCRSRSRSPPSRPRPQWTPTACRECCPPRSPATASSWSACTTRIRHSTRWRLRRPVRGAGSRCRVRRDQRLRRGPVSAALELLGALENPGILVYRRPDVLFARMSGFADSETVAQAAANARR